MQRELEITSMLKHYNPSSRTVNLNNYQIKGTNNGTAWGDNGERELALGGTLLANSVYIICTDAADPAIIAKADLALPMKVLFIIMVMMQ